MLSKEQVLEAIAGGRKHKALDGRDFNRLVRFLPYEQWKLVGCELREGGEVKPPIEWNRDNILLELEHDLDFGFEKAMHKRGISAHCMYEVVKMWMWILEDDLGKQHILDESDFDDYTYYGLPFFKAVALKYNLPNPIGGDLGSEKKYDEEEYVPPTDGN